MKRIILIFLMLFLTLGVVASADLPDFSVPDSFSWVGNGSYMNNLKEGIFIFAKNNISTETILSYQGNFSFDKYEGNIYNFTDTEKRNVGYLEVVEFNGEEYIVLSAVYIKNKDSQMGDAYNNIIEFNKLNNVKPIEI